MKSLILAICLLCSPVLAAVSSHDAHASEECFASVQQLRLVHKTGWYCWKHTPNGWCYHLGRPRQKTVSLAMRPSPSKAGVGISSRHASDAPKPVPKWTKEFGTERAKYMWPHPGETHVPKYEIYPSMIPTWWEPAHWRPLW